MLHRDQPIHYLNIMRAARVVLNAEDTWLVGAIIGMAERATTPGRFAPEMLDCLRGHGRYRHIGRVAVVRRLGLANQLHVVESANAPGIENLMTGTYSCFVNPAGSLSALGPQFARVFDDTIAVLDSFATQGRPVQRSIARVGEMGLKSGWCVPLVLSAETCGYLFVNFRDQPSQGDGGSELDHLVLSVLTLSGRARLEASGVPSPIYRALAAERPESYEGRIFEPLTLEKLIGDYLQILGGERGQVKVEAKAVDCLVSHGNLAQLLARLLAIAPETSAPARVTVAVQDDRVRCTLAHPEGTAVSPAKRLLSMLNQDAPALGMTVNWATAGITLDYPYDGPAKALYSTDF